MWNFRLAVRSTQICMVVVAALHENRMFLVSNKRGAAIADELGFTELMAIGKSYEGEGPTVHMKAELFEAVLGAMYEDSNYSLAEVQDHYTKLFPFKPRHDPF
jgi:dsRNA-specific ribonuclease